MNKIVLITGSSRGIGAATAIYLAKEGYDICINYIKDEKAAYLLLEKIKCLGVNVIAVKADVSKEIEVNKLFLTIDKELGRLTHLVNNAGILLPQMKLLDMDEKRINKILTNNVTSYFLCSKEAIKRMKSGSSIVNVSSIASKLGAPNEYIDYAASKGAIDTLTIGLALEIAHLNIRVNCVRPGLIYTSMHKDGGDEHRVDRLKEFLPLKRGGRVEEIASIISYLLSDKASFVTGTFIDAAGGK